MRNKKVLLLAGVALSLVFSGSSMCGESKTSGAIVSDITSADRDAWVSSITPVFTPSQNVRIGQANNNTGILFNNAPLPNCVGYFGYLYTEWGFKMRPSGEFHKKHLDRLTRSGISLQQLDVFIDMPGGKVYMDEAKKQIVDILKYQPNALFLLRLGQFRAGEAFSSKYPDDVVVFNDGSKSHFNWPQLALLNDPALPRYSLASRHWEREAAQGLVNLAKMISEWEYKDRIVGVVLGAGACGQWLWWSDFDYENYCIDFSPVMHRRYVEFLKEKYKTDSALQKAWNDPKVTFATVVIPTQEERGIDLPNSVNEIPPHEFVGGFGYFRNPNTGNNQKVVDYYICMSRELGRRIDYLCRVFKQATDNRLLAGAFFGPLGVIGYKIEGQSYFNEVLESEYVDFWADPWSYQTRWEGEPLFITAPVGSMKLHNKVYIVECDIRTSDMELKRQLGASKDAWGDLMNIRKNFIRVITNGAYGYWFEMEFGWYENDKIFQGFKEASDISKLAMSLDNSRNAEIAVIYDSESIFYTADWLDYLTIARQTSQGLSFMGADYDTFSTIDISRPEMSKYKFFIFPNAFAMTDKTRQDIKQHLQKDGNVLLWIYASGLINKDRSVALSLDNMKELTGIKFGYVEGKKESSMKITKDGLFTENFKTGDVIGDFLRPITLQSNPPENPWKANPIKTDPQFYADDNSVEKLAVFTDTGKPGFVVKEMDGWTSVYFGSIAVPSGVLRNLAKKAGVHIYTDTDNIVNTSKSFLGMHLTTDGKKQIKLPKKTDVYDMFEKRLIGRDIDTFEVSAPKHSTVMYFMGDYDELSKLLKK